MDEIKSTTGSPMWSYHWFITLMARHKHVGEFLMDDKIKNPSESILASWGSDLFKTSIEIIYWFTTSCPYKSVWNISSINNPTKPGKYEVYSARTNKQFYETWGSYGWVRNTINITHWREIIPPAL